MGPDFRVLVAKARKIAQAYWKVYGEYPPTKVLVQEVAGVMQKATQSGYVPSFVSVPNHGVRWRWYPGQVPGLWLVWCTELMFPQWCSSVRYLTPDRWMGRT